MTMAPARPRMPNGVCIDEDDLVRLGHHPWRLDAYGYVVRTGRRGEPKNVYLHLEIMQAPEGMQVDHRNTNKLDNRKSNLRAVTRSGNQQNRPQINHQGSSHYRGVYFDQERRKWGARAAVKGKNYRIGRFDTEEQAHAAVVAWRREHMPTSEADRQ